MNAYPRLSVAAYEDEKIHLKEVIEMMAFAAADVWRYYKGTTIDEDSPQMKVLQGYISQATVYLQTDIRFEEEL